MLERVTVCHGTENILIVCPHGHYLDDENTNVLSLALAKELNAHAVINNGWKRNPSVDVLNSLANCNHGPHCKEDVVKEEFYDPIGKVLDDMFQDSLVIPDPDIITPLVLVVHGVGNNVRNKTGVKDLDIIVGYGNGHKPHFTCASWRKNLFVDFCNNAGYVTAEGVAGGAYSARSHTNMTQVIHRTWDVDVLQVEFIYALRKDDAIVKAVASDFAKVIGAMHQLTEYDRPDTAVVFEV